MALDLAALTTTALIFGGCCSNVFALEAIIKKEPSTGLLITFTQFLATTLLALPTQFRRPSGNWDEGYSTDIIRKPRVPVRRWSFIATAFFAINMLNNWAFAFRISVPVHIILRSFGSVTTMGMGWARGKRYSVLQVGSVGLLTVGVVVSAWADSEGKGKSMTLESSSAQSTSEFSTGLAILLLAQLLSAWMGAYVEDTYTEYHAEWTENLFYTHFLSMPLFLPLAGPLRRQYARLSASPPLDHRNAFESASGPWWAQALPVPMVLQRAAVNTISTTPSGLVFLLVNSLTQLACISGVNLLSAKSSAVTVTIVLNIRKLVSFIFSTLFFGHQLSGKMVLGSAMVFGSGALYGWETSWRLPRERRQQEEEKKEKKAQ
ncbi:hypothetical protein LTR62_005429 [Meristemomyces frigidus]|uniref:UAA transporter n=1 Tax=Meristemomyces frigidus TaxID=1508187 RepID=A0AAN7TL40_9PEZI|nr:hypothetical protein LTR62_005429 [Meristemomyces frigidus]